MLYSVRRLEPARALFPPQVRAAGWRQFADTIWSRINSRARARAHRCLQAGEQAASASKAARLALYGVRWIEISAAGVGFADSGRATQRPQLSPPAPALRTRARLLAHRAHWPFLGQRHHCRSLWRMRARAGCVGTVAADAPAAARIRDAAGVCRCAYGTPPALPRPIMCKQNQRRVTSSCLPSQGGPWPDSCVAAGRRTPSTFCFRLHAAFLGAGGSLRLPLLYKS